MGDNTHQTGYGNSGRDSGYGDSRTGTSEQPVHNSKLMNKLDPRVDADAVADRDGSGRHNKEAGIAGASGLGAAAHHGSHKDRTDRNDYSGRDNTSSYGSPADRALPTRSREDYSTAHHGAEHGSLAHNPASRQADYSGQPQSGHHAGSGARAAAAAAGGQGHHGHYGQEKDHHGSQPVPYSMTGAHTSGHDPATQMAGKVRSHFHCMNCGHKNDASHLTDHQGGAVSGRTALHCMDCGHRNEVGHMLR
jgi:hypothetical protein